MSADKKKDVLRRTPLFAALSEAERELVARQAVERRFAAGEALFHEGEPCTGLYVIASGRVKVVKVSPSGREITLAVEEGPSTVAEVPVFDGGPFPAGVSAISDVVAYHLPKQQFRMICRERPEVALKVLAVVGMRLRALVTLVEGVTFGSVRRRLAQALVEFAGQGGVRFALPVTHEELAFRLGTVREVVSRNLSRFQAEGLIRLQRRQVELLDRAGLEREAETEL